MYASSLIGRQWRAAIDRIDHELQNETATHGLEYMPDIDCLLDQRHRLSRALTDSGELPTIEVP